MIKPDILKSRNQSVWAFLLCARVRMRACLMAEGFPWHPAVISRANDWPVFCRNIFTAKWLLMWAVSLRTVRRRSMLGAYLVPSPKLGTHTGHFIES